MRMVDLIIKKRQGQEHTKEEINFLIKTVVDPATYRDYQLSAWLMAVCWRGMSMDETAFLTDAMARSGEMLDLSEIGPIVGDKHSTGGVGDKTTLVFVPMLAAAGIPMAKLSGRGLGHTGGTLDKLEAIPGFNVRLATDDFIRQVKEIGEAVGGQTNDLAPADGLMYALRDVTGTVESIPLIAASVVCKKIASGANLIILDVKCGSGAFMDTEEKAVELARTMVEVGKRLKRPVTAVVTDMEQPLGMAVGHTLEVIEAIETLKGNGPADLQELCLSLGAMAMVQAGKSKTKESARKELEEIISSGKALEKFRELIKRQGGNAAVIEDYTLMPQAKIKHEVKMTDDGEKWISKLNGKTVAEACKLMGAGRSKKEDPINLAVGVVLNGKVGSKFKKGDTIATIYGDTDDQIKLAEEKIRQAIQYSSTEIEIPPVIRAAVANEANLSLAQS
ncbi:MAG: thymidine phosphorylase [Candidatus Obscuribacterales bacterium]|nr:thymidine phosphorylase [Candidatus Obscuribacterales bacterium]